MGVEVKCCVYNGDPRVIDKKPTLVKSIVCRIPEPTNVVDTELLLTNTEDIERCNYFVIGFRKYFKDREIKTSSKMIRVMLHEDVISTWIPRVYIIGMISNASDIISKNVEQKYLLDSNKLVSRIAIRNGPGDVTNRHVIVVQSPQGWDNKPTS